MLNIGRIERAFSLGNDDDAVAGELGGDLAHGGHQGPPGRFVVGQCAGHVRGADRRLGRTAGQQIRDRGSNVHCITVDA